jgi:hypothetical protein
VAGRDPCLLRDVGFERSFSMEKPCSEALPELKIRVDDALPQNLAFSLSQGGHYNRRHMNVSVYLRAI